MKEKLQKVKEAFQNIEKELDYDLTNWRDIDSIKNEYQSALVLIDTIIAELDSPWQTMETAPKDGTVIDVYLGNDEFPSRYTDVSWREPTESEYWVNGSDWPSKKDGTFNAKAGWFVSDGYTRKLEGDSYPTHWQPLPKQP